MSRFAEAMAPVLKVLFIVVIIAAWVEANAKRIQPDIPFAPPAASFTKAPPPPGFDPFRRAEAPAPQSSGGNCTPTVDRRNAQRIAPPRPVVIQT